jgi:hypothetical protein
MTVESNRNEWVVYAPPKSASFGHQSRLRDARKAWLATQEFLNAQTDYTLGHHRRMTCYGPTPQTEAAVATARLAAARETLGPETSVETNHVHWDVDPAKLSAAVDFALDDDRYPNQNWGPTALHFHYWFTWKDAEIRGMSSELRDVRSGLGVRIGSGAVFLQPRFVFPAAFDSHDLRTLLATVEPTTPFRFRDQYFQRWLQPTRKGSAGVTRKLDRNWRSAWQAN